MSKFLTISRIPHAMAKPSDTAMVTSIPINTLVISFDNSTCLIACKEGATMSPQTRDMRRRSSGDWRGGNGKTQRSREHIPSPLHGRVKSYQRTT